MRKCKYLSNPIYVDTNNIKKYIDEQYEKFINNFVTNITYFEGLPINVKHKKDTNSYGEILDSGNYKDTCFAHIISKQTDNNIPGRDLDIQRLRTCHWTKELIDLYNDLKSNCNTCPNFLSKFLVERKDNVIYIFCKSVRYVIVLQKIKSECYIIKTAFYVDKEYSYRNLMKKLI